MKPQIRYGWIPDKPDSRDFLYKSIRPKLVKIPEMVDLRDKMPAVEDQGQLGSCTAQALVGNLEFLDRLPDNKYEDVSRLFIYYNERVLESSVEEDAGASLRDGIKTLAQQGYCFENLWPYDVEKFAVKPPEECYSEASKKRISTYYRLNNLNDMLVCLADGFPFVLGITVFDNLETEEAAKTGLVGMPGPDDGVCGGHAVLCVGYDKPAKTFIIRNSWGEDWGMKGYFTLPFAYLQKLARDFWTIRK